MKQRLLIVFLLLTVIVTTLVIMVFHGEEVFHWPFESELEISYPSYVTSDTDGNMYVIDNSLRRIIKTTAEGDIFYIIEGGTREEESFYNATALVPDQEGNLYVLTRQLDNLGFYVIQERVIRYDTQGKFAETVFSTKYSGDQRVSQLVQRGRMTGLQYQEGRISWFEITENDVNRYGYNLSSSQLDFSQIMKFPDAHIFLSSIVELSDGNFVYITKDGYISYHNSQEGSSPDSAGYTFMSLPREEDREDEEGEVNRTVTNAIGDPVLYSGDFFKRNGIPSVPWFIRRGVDDAIYVSDLTLGTVFYLAPDGSTQNILSPETLEAEGLNYKDQVFYTFTVGTDGTLYTVLDDAILAVAGGGIQLHLASLNKPHVSIAASFGLQLLFLVSALSSLFLIYRFYAIVMNRRVSIILKQIGIYIPLTILALLVTSKLVFDNMAVRYQKELTERLSLMVQLMTQAAEPGLFEEVSTQNDFMNDSYRRIRERFHALLNDNRDEWNNGYYFALHRVLNGKIYSMMWLNDGISMIHPFSYLNEPEGVYIEALRGQIATEKAADAWGLWMDAVGPIYNSEGEIVALLEIGKDYTNYAMENNRLFKSVLVNTLVVSLVFVILFVLISYFLLISLRNLRNGATMIAQGQWEIEIKAKGNDEVADLIVSFNDMARALKKHVSEIIALNRAYYRFVPEQFLKFLNRESVVDVELGDQIQAEMTVMFTDIRSFTSMSEKMSPRENFDFLNTYLSLVGPVVRENNGFIDKYIGDAIMALFPQSAEDAVKTAIGILQKVYEFNKARVANSQDQLSIGFGIHTGLLMLGILGEKERVDSTVISDNVNLASRLEGLTKKFGASIIISSSVLEAMSNREMYLVRYLGKIQVKGKESAVDIYEVMDGLVEKERISRAKTRDYLETAIASLMDQDVKSAFRNLYEAYKIDSEDKAILYYLMLARQLEKNPERFKANGIVMTDK